MPEALARAHHDAILSRPVRSAQPRSRRRMARGLALWLLTLQPRSIAGAALAAVLIGIVVNALFLQKAHRPAPLSVAAQSAAPVAPPAPAPVPQSAPAFPAASETAAPEPPPRPAEATNSARSADPIRDLLRGDASKDSSHSILEAQAALARLGYAVKPDGVAGGATVAAIQQFQRAHGLPATGEITPKLLRQLAAAN